MYMHKLCFIICVFKGKPYGSTPRPKPSELGPSELGPSRESKRESPKAEQQKAQR